MIALVQTLIRILSLPLALCNPYTSYHIQPCPHICFITPEPNLSRISVSRRLQACGAAIRESEPDAAEQRVNGDGDSREGQRVCREVMFEDEVGIADVVVGDAVGVVGLVRYMEM